MSDGRASGPMRYSPGRRAPPCGALPNRPSAVSPSTTASSSRVSRRRAHDARTRARLEAYMADHPIAWSASRERLGVRSAPPRPTPKSDRAEFSLLRQSSEISPVCHHLQRKDRGRQPRRSSNSPACARARRQCAPDAGIGDGTVLVRVMRAMHARFPTMPFYPSARRSARGHPPHA